MNNLQKIMLATQTINFLCASIYETQTDLQRFEGTGEEVAKENDKFLAQTVKDLSITMDVIGEYLNNRDMASTDDDRATKFAFSILNA